MEKAITPNPNVSTPINKVTEARTMSFPDAIRQVINGKKITRVSWANMDYGYIRDGWLTIFTKGEFHTWSVNDGDMEGEDWVVFSKKELNA